MVAVPEPPALFPRTAPTLVTVVSSPMLSVPEPPLPTKRLADEFKAKGVDALYCLSVNDAFVMKAWQAAQNADAITMLADGDGSWTRALGLAKETGAFGGLRAQRFALIANDGVVERLFVEAPGKFEVSDAQSLLAAL